MLRRAQVRVRAAVDRDLDQVWRQVWARTPDGPTKPYAVRDAFLRLTPTLVERYGDDAATLAADWYEAQRSTAGVGGAFTVPLRPSPYLDAVEGTVRRTAGALWTESPGLMLTGLKSKVGKYVLAAGRQTITDAAAADPRAVGFRRVTRVGSCDFCVMLAGRGGVYKRETAFFASHGDCNCAAVPSWDADAPEVDVRLYEASVRTTGMTPSQRAEHDARVRSWIATNLAA